MSDGTTASPEMEESSMTVYDLVLQYESDVLTRIQALEGDRAELINELGNREDEDSHKDWDDQIAHWKATLAAIQTVIKREHLRETFAVCMRQTGHPRRSGMRRALAGVRNPEARVEQVAVTAAGLSAGRGLVVERTRSGLGGL